MCLETALFKEKHFEWSKGARCLEKSILESFSTSKVTAVLMPLSEIILTVFQF